MEKPTSTRTVSTLVCGALQLGQQETGQHLTVGDEGSHHKSSSLGKEVKERIINLSLTKILF
jgi:hypothetical protein